MAIKKIIQWIIAIVIVTTIVVVIDWHYCHQTNPSDNSQNELKK